MQSDFEWLVYADWLEEQGDERGPQVREMIDQDAEIPWNWEYRWRGGVFVGGVGDAVGGGVFGDAVGGIGSVGGVGAGVGSVGVGSVSVGGGVGDAVGVGGGVVGGGGVGQS